MSEQVNRKESSLMPTFEIRKPYWRFDWMLQS